MEKITLQIGSVTHTSGGHVLDTRRDVEFRGEEDASISLPEVDSGRTTNRGRIETLYRTDDDKLVAHVEEWSHWLGESTTHELHAVTEQDLGVGGLFEALGNAAGYGRPLTLDEALTELDRG